MKVSVPWRFLGRVIYTDTNESVGQVHELLIAPKGSQSYAIVRAGGFGGLWRQFALPINQLYFEDGELLLGGASQTGAEALPRIPARQNTEVSMRVSVCEMSSPRQGG